MLPTQEEINKDIEQNLKSLFEDKKIKLSKKAKEQVEKVLRSAIVNKYKLFTVKQLVENIDQGSKKQEKEQSDEG